MPRAVRFDRYGEVDVLEVVEVERPAPGRGQLLVSVKAAAVNPGEEKIRFGLLHDRFPATFPSGQGSDLAGVVAEVGAGVEEFAPGDEVIGFTDNRASHADLVLVESGNATRKPPEVSWEVAGSLHVAGATAYAMVQAVSPQPDEVVIFAGATGGVGTLGVQLARRTGATVIGIAGGRHHDWLRAHDVIPVTYGDGIEGRLREASDGRFDALLDAHGGGYVELALELGIRPDRIDTIVDFAAAQKHGTKADGNAAAAGAGTLRELAELVRRGEFEVPIAQVFPLDQVREAYRELERSHPLGKVVLRP
jgi:NADPH:quinone reductase-like Zn-dependent oxidoreductase